ncbi:MULTISPECIES: DUF7019 family protein [Streptomyces]|uniref:DUF7019 family protein n=1 Tax=Streptomyces eurythermus TaxID=42237 RepID=A0ABW6YQJ6_9ACTN|nr:MULTISPECIES: SAVMC3_10250 family protein [Streptomyces]QIS74360.1 hypothetical protein HB370_33875 [Streptomyces sp. DSM 40868]
MRYYLYVSEAKVEMLHAQIPQKLLSRLTTEAKVDLKVAGVSVQRPARQDAGLYERLDVVEGFLEREYDVGWVSSDAGEEPGPGFWFRGEAGLRVSWDGRAEGPVLMSGAAGDTLVSLVGSVHHLVGHSAAPELGRVGHSWLPALYRLLRDASRAEAAGEPVARPGGGVLHDVVEVCDRLAGPAMWCEFLARELLRGQVTDGSGARREVVVGTPLYVALSEERPGG